MIDQMLAGDSSSGVHFPPGVGDFFPPALTTNSPEWLTKYVLLPWLAVGLIITFFLVAYRRPALVPSRMQWMAESLYGLNRDAIARQMIGPEGVRFASYFTTLFSFILLTNLFGIVPLIQTSPNSHIGTPIMLALVSYALFNYLGIRRFGFVRYFKQALVPDAPWFILPILIPIEFFSTFIVRPVTLALRLFANMFAGHMILLVFTLAGFALLGANAWFIKPVSLLAWAMAIAMTFLEAIVILLQAYVFVALTSSYISGALAEEH